MFGDFGSPTQRHREVPPRDHSPFGSFSRSHHPMFPNHGDWDEDPFHNRSQNVQKSSPGGSGGHVERIIPIQIIGAPSQPPTQEPSAVPISIPTVRPTTSPSTQPTSGNTLEKSDASGKEAGEEPVDKRYGTQRHHTVENLQVRGAEDTDKQRAKSEPPVKWNLNDAGARNTALPTQEIPIQHQQPEAKQNPANMTRFGGSLGKSKPQENGGVRNIPIFVEGRPTPARPTGEAAFRKGQPSHPSTQIPQKNRFQPDQPEPSTTPPPPPKKVTKDTMQIIQEIVEEVQKYEKEVNDLPPTTKKSKNYLYLDEMLTRNLIKLDTIETDGKEEIRLARRECIKLIQKVISVLESKVEELALVPVSESAATPNDPESMAVSVPATDVTDTSKASSQPVPDAPTSTSMDLALTPTTSVTSPVVVTAEAAMEISPTHTINPVNTATAVSTEEPMMTVVGENVSV